MEVMGSVSTLPRGARTNMECRKPIPYHKKTERQTPPQSRNTNDIIATLVLLVSAMGIQYYCIIEPAIFFEFVPNNLVKDYFPQNNTGRCHRSINVLNTSLPQVETHGFPVCF